MDRQTPPASAPAPQPFKRCNCGRVISPAASCCSECERTKEYFGVMPKDPPSYGPKY